MTENITVEIQDAIKKNLPEMVGKELNKILSNYEVLKVQLSTAQDQNKKHLKEYQEIRELDRQYEENETKRLSNLEKERELNTKEEILKIREENAKQRVDEIRNLTETVFQSNRMNYGVNLTKSCGGEYDNSTGRTAPFRIETTNGTISENS